MQKHLYIFLFFLASALLVSAQAQSARELTSDASRLGIKGSGGVRTHNGLPTLYIDGKPHNGLAFSTYYAVPKEFKEFSDAGVNLFSFVTTPTGLAYHNIQPNLRPELPLVDGPKEYREQRALFLRLDDLLSHSGLEGEFTTLSDGTSQDRPGQV